MNNVYFTFQDGTIKMFEVMSRIQGLKHNGNRPISAIVYVTNDTYYNDENYPKWLDHITMNTLAPHVDTSKAIKEFRCDT